MAVSDPPTVCGARGYLPEDLVNVALRFESRPGETQVPDVSRHLRCTLQPHPGLQHHAIVMELAGVETGAVWAHWSDRQFPRELDVYPDCPRGADSPSPCTLFAGHPGRCSHELHDPLEDISRVISG
jgi:hypothetical protein